MRTGPTGTTYTVQLVKMYHCVGSGKLGIQSSGHLCTGW